MASDIDVAQDGTRIRTCAVRCPANVRAGKETPMDCFAVAGGGLVSACPFFVRATPIWNGTKVKLVIRCQWPRPAPWVVVEEPQEP